MGKFAFFYKNQVSLTMLHKTISTSASHDISIKSVSTYKDSKSSKIDQNPKNLDSTETNHEYIKRVFVKGLKTTTTQLELTDYLSQFASQDKFKVELSINKNKKHRGFAFVTIYSEDFYNIMHSIKHCIDGSKLQVKDAVSKDNIIEQEKNLKLMPRKIFVGGIPQNTANETLYEYFSKYGEIEDINVTFKRENKGKGFGFILFIETNVIDKVLADYEKHTIAGVWIECKIARPKFYENMSPSRQESLITDNTKSITKQFDISIRQLSEAAINSNFDSNDAMNNSPVNSLRKTSPFEGQVVTNKSKLATTDTTNAGTEHQEKPTKSMIKNSKRKAKKQAKKIENVIEENAIHPKLDNRQHHQSFQGERLSFGPSYNDLTNFDMKEPIRHVHTYVPNRSFNVSNNCYGQRQWDCLLGSTQPMSITGNTASFPSLNTVDSNSCMQNFQGYDYHGIYSDFDDRSMKMNLSNDPMISLQPLQKQNTHGSTYLKKSTLREMSNQTYASSSNMRMYNDSLSNGWVSDLTSPGIGSEELFFYESQIRLHKIAKTPGCLNQPIMEKIQPFNSAEIKPQNDYSEVCINNIEMQQNKEQLAKKRVLVKGNPDFSQKNCRFLDKAIARETNMTEPQNQSKSQAENLEILNAFCGQIDSGYVNIGNYDDQEELAKELGSMKYLQANNRQYSDREETPDDYAYFDTYKPGMKQNPEAIMSPSGPSGISDDKNQRIPLHIKKSSKPFEPVNEYQRQVSNQQQEYHTSPEEKNLSSFKNISEEDQMMKYIQEQERQKLELIKQQQLQIMNDNLKIQYMQQQQKQYQHHLQQQDLQMKYQQMLQLEMQQQNLQRRNLNQSQVIDMDNYNQQNRDFVPPPDMSFPANFVGNNSQANPEIFLENKHINYKYPVHSTPERQQRNQPMQHLQQQQQPEQVMAMTPQQQQQNIANNIAILTAEISPTLLKGIERTELVEKLQKRFEAPIDFNTGNSQHSKSDFISDELKKLFCLDDPESQIDSRERNSSIYSQDLSQWDNIKKQLSCSSPEQTISNIEKTVTISKKDSFSISNFSDNLTKQKPLDALVKDMQRQSTDVTGDVTSFNKTEIGNKYNSDAIHSCGGGSGHTFKREISGLIEEEEDYGTRNRVMTMPHNLKIDENIEENYQSELNQSQGKRAD